MLPLMTLQTGHLLSWKQISSRQYKGIMFPGSVLYSVEQNGLSVYSSISRTRDYSLSYYAFHSTRPTTFNISEARADLRIEFALTGQCTIHSNVGKEMLFNKGSWQLTNTKGYTLRIPANFPFTVFSLRFSVEMLQKLGLQNLLEPIEPNLAPVVMKDMVHALLRNPYSDGLRPLFYDHCVRRILFYHLTTSVMNVFPSTASPPSQFISDNFNRIEPYHKLADSDLLKMKKYYRQLFVVNVFDRLIQRRMEHSKKLLKSTDLSIEEVARQTGFDSAADFINSFRKRFGNTPREFRNNSSG